MTGFHCPGQDMRYWRSDDISEGACPRCGEAIEFWKDDSRRRCPSCGAMVLNPNFDVGCAKWCQFADRCLGAGAVEQTDAALSELTEKVFKTASVMRIAQALFLKRRQG